MSTTTTTVEIDKSRFPEIVLDTTLAELIAEDHDGKADESLCTFKPCVDPQAKTAPLNKKFLITSSQAIGGDDLAHLQLENVSYLLSFWGGNIEVLLLACEGFNNDDAFNRDIISQHAQRSYSVLNEKQRPRPKIYATEDDFTRNCKDRSTKVRWAFAVDLAEQIPCFVHPEVQYRLNSKRWLAECPLRSANDRIIDPEGSCAEHMNKLGFWYFDSNCHDCKGTVEKETLRIRDRLQSTEPPFVLKLTQSLGSVGTMLVRDKKDRDKTIEQITKIQKESLSLMTSDNAHIYPTSLILSDFLPGDTNALNFYVRRDGSVKFLGACHQISTRASGRQHTALTWDQQDRLEQKFRDTLDDIGKVLHAEGYYGPCGADVMETEDGTQYVIDLNVRTSTSTILGVLKGHCQQRKFNACGVYECLLLSVSRDDLETKFQKELEEGRFILMGETRLGKKDVWAYPIVIAGEDQEAMKALGARILELEATGGEAAQDAGGA